MHGMINRGLQSYICDVHGVDVWEETCEQAKLPFCDFEYMLTYDDSTTEDLLNSFGALTHRKRDEILEDFGTYMVSDNALNVMRRLLKFGGSSYVEFLHSLNFVYDRAKMAVPDLDIPTMELVENNPTQFVLYTRFRKRGFGPTLLGLLRALANDYNMLVSITHSRRILKHVDEDIFTINLLRKKGCANNTPELVRD